MGHRRGTRPQAENFGGRFSMNAFTASWWSVVMWAMAWYPADNSSNDYNELRSPSRSKRLVMRSTPPVLAAILRARASGIHRSGALKFFQRIQLRATADWIFQHQAQRLAQQHRGYRRIRL